MTYDVIYLNRARAVPGLATDMVTSSRREALERARVLMERGTPAHVTNRYGDRVA